MAGPAGKMPVAVMAESSFSFRKLLDQCENQELEVTIRLVGSRVASGRAGLQGNGAWGPRGLGPAACGRGSWACGVRAAGACSEGEASRPGLPELARSFLLFVLS